MMKENKKRLQRILLSACENGSLEVVKFLNDVL